MDPKYVFIESSNAQRCYKGEHARNDLYQLHL